MTNDTHFKCWQCGVDLGRLIFPISRRDECEACRAELHVCRFCTQYDPRVSDSCREDRAEAVTDKAHANFCDYFEINARAFQSGKSQGKSSVLSNAEALFGGQGAKQGIETEEPSSKVQDELKKLFDD